MDSANATVFVGKEFGEYAFKLYHELEKEFNGASSNYTELQLNRNLGDSSSEFARSELFDSKDPIVMVGVGLRF